MWFVQARKVQQKHRSNFVANVPVETSETSQARSPVRGDQISSHNLQRILVFPGSMLTQFYFYFYVSIFGGAAVSMM